MDGVIPTSIPDRGAEGLESGNAWKIPIYPGKQGGLEGGYFVSSGKQGNKVTYDSRLVMG